MLSANKTKDFGEIKKFINWRDFYGSYKLDGLTLVVIYENGKLQMTYETMSVLADYFGTSVDYLLGRTDEKKPYPKSKRK